MASIKDVAGKAGVAISTVSKVLNGYPGVSKETKEKVEAAIKELNFVPNSIAAALSSKKAGRVALLIHMSSQTKARDEIDMQYISGALHKAKELHVDLVVEFFSMIENLTLEEKIQHFKAQNIEGIIFYGLTKEDTEFIKLLECGQFKIVAVDVPVQGSDKTRVGIDHKKAQREVALRTIEENNSDSLLYIAGSKESYAAMERLEAIEELAAEKHLRLEVAYGDYSENKAREITFEKGYAYGVIACGSDLMAIGAMRALIEMDIFRPVCGFDGLILMGYAGKQMNTIQQDFAGVSARAVEEMQRLLAGKKGTTIVTPYSIERMQYLDLIEGRDWTETESYKAFRQKKESQRKTKKDSNKEQEKKKRMQKG